MSDSEPKTYRIALGLPFNFLHSGKIMWARQLFRRINEPMELFQDKAPHLLKTPEAKKIIRNYNKVGKVLLEFEVLYHREWIRQIDCIRAGK